MVPNRLCCEAKSVGDGASANQGDIEPVVITVSGSYGIVTLLVLMMMLVLCVTLQMRLLVGCYSFLLCGYVYMTHLSNSVPEIDTALNIFILSIVYLPQFFIYNIVI